MKLPHDPLNIIVSGVGGQGNILASDMISRALCEAGLSVSVGETYGATQRGGSVVSHVRCSAKQLYGPLIPLGQGHVIIGFEPLEVYRILRDYGHQDVRVVMNSRPFYPLDTLQKKSQYPPLDQLTSLIDQLACQTVVIDGTELAIRAGNPQTQNVVMVGAVCGLGWLPLDPRAVADALGQIFDGRKLEVNQTAFELGFGTTAGKN